MTIFDRFENWLDNTPNKAKKLIWKMGKITINGESHEVLGNNIVATNDKVLVNGKVIVSGLSGTVKIQFEGDLANLDCTSAVVNGDVHGSIDGNTVTVNGDVSGDIEGTSVKCGNVGGDIDSTSVTCGKVRGDIDAMSVKKIKK